jgi:hypothetical protein
MDTPGTPNIEILDPRGTPSFLIPIFFRNLSPTFPLYSFTCHIKGSSWNQNQLSPVTKKSHFHYSLSIGECQSTSSLSQLSCHIPLSTQEEVERQREPKEKMSTSRKRRLWRLFQQQYNWDDDGEWRWRWWIFRRLWTWICFSRRVSDSIDNIDHRQHWLVKVPRRHCYSDLQVWKDSKLCQCGKKELAPHEKNEEIGGDHCALFYILLFKHRVRYNSGDNEIHNMAY